MSNISCQCDVSILIDLFNFLTFKAFRSYLSHNFVEKPSIFLSVVIAVRLVGEAEAKIGRVFLLKITRSTQSFLCGIISCFEFS